MTLGAIELIAPEKMVRHLSPYLSRLTWCFTDAIYVMYSRG